MITHFFKQLMLMMASVLLYSECQDDAEVRDADRVMEEIYHTFQGNFRKFQC